MLRILFFLSICLLISIPHHTSIQDVSIPLPEYRSHRQSRQAFISTNRITPIENLLQWLTEQQYQYETAYYALALNNVLPNFAKFFHERSEEKYEIIKGLIRLYQILNLDINLQFIASNPVNRPLRLLSFDRINQTNLAQYISDLKSDECEKTFLKLSNVYRQIMNTTIPLQMYLKNQIYSKQILTCKITSDIYMQIDRFIQTNCDGRSMPFSFMFFDSRANTLLSK